MTGQAKRGFTTGMASDTIYALSSGPPPSGVAVIRVSGPGVRAALISLTGSLPEPRRATLRSVRDEDAALLDRGIVLFFPDPDSFTGEDVAELQVHGGRAVIAAVLGALERLPGFRAAEAGEFTRRAFVNGRVDLTEVEGLADLIAAETEAQRWQALRQADGELRRVFEGWRGRLVGARALIEAELDFADEEDVPGSVSEAAWGEIAAVAAEIGRFLDDGHRGERLRDGAEVVVLGPPNAGKSSLINALARRDVAIVTAEPGTTRDLIEVRLDLNGYPVTLVDTAGLREAGGLIEAEGIRRATARAAAADLVLWLSEAAEAGSVPVVPDGVPVLRVGTKGDLIDSAKEQSLLSAGFDLVISTRTGAGLEELLRRLTGVLADRFSAGESVLLTRSRHRSGLERCREALAAALEGTGRGLELRADDVRRATDALGRITGVVGVEDILEVIFREFCIGK